MQFKRLNIKKNSFYTVVPARSGSKSIKHKNIKYLNGIPLIGYALSISKLIKRSEKTVFSSDSIKYLKIAKKYNPDILHLRSKKNSSKTLLSLFNYENDIIKISREIIKCNKNKKKLLVVGNGGSCADAEHFTGELVCTFNNKKRKPFSAISLTTNNAALTAWSNDFNFDSFFERQVKANGKRGDILFLLSTGGGNKKSKASMNLISAANEGRKKGLKIISLIGKEGGELKKISDIYIHVKNNNTAVIQEAHMSILHAICIYLDNNK
tara:strand:- start:12935 stop:13735 length:801 start_codon:yes stop_codon:yes gene_type:complete